MTVPFIGYEFGTPQNIEREPGIVNNGDLGAGGSGKSANHSILFGVEFSFPQAFSKRVGLAIEMGLIQSQGRFTSDPYRPRTEVVDDGSGLPVIAENQFDVELSALLVEVGIYPVFDVAPFRFEVGPWLGYRYTASLVQTEQILSPQGASFVDGGTTRVVAAGDPIASYPLRFGLVGKAIHEVYISPSLTILPWLGTRLDMESLINKDQGFRSMSVGAGVGVILNLSGNDNSAASARSPAPVRPDPVPTEVPSVPPTISVDLYNATPGSSRNQRIVISEESVLQTRYLPLPTFLPLEGIGASRMSLSREETRTFDRSELARLGTAEYIERIPDVIAMRLVSDASARVDLTTILPRNSSESEKREVVEASERLRSYLVSGWGIDPSRIHSRPSAVGSRAGVRLTSSSSTLFEPMVLQRRLSSFAEPRVGVQKVIPDSLADRDWEIVLWQDRKEIGRFNRDGESGEMTISPDRNGEASRTGGVIVAELRIDAEGESELVGRDTLQYQYTVVENPERQENVWIFLPEVIQSGEVWDEKRVESRLTGTNHLFLKMIPHAVPTGSRFSIRGNVESDSEGGVIPEQLASLLLEGLHTSGKRIGSMTIEPFPNDDPLTTSLWSDCIQVTVEQ